MITSIYIPTVEEKAIAEAVSIRLLEKLDEEVLEVELQHYILKIMLGAFESKHNIIASKIPTKKLKEGYRCHICDQELIEKNTVKEDGKTWCRDCWNKTRTYY